MTPTQTQKITLHLAAHFTINCYLW